MKIFTSRKADVGIVTVIIIVIILAFIYALVDIGSRECRSNRDCGKDAYCGSDFACHQIPVIERTTTKGDYTMPALILGIAMIITALILKWDKIRTPKIKDVKEETSMQLPKKENNGLKSP